MIGQYPGATWRGPVVNRTPSGMVMPPIGLVLHIQQGSEGGTDAWFRDPASRVSAHFGAPKSGGIDQWVIIGDEAWHAASANRTYVGVEIEGSSGDRLTGAQSEALAHLIAWMHTDYGMPLAVATVPGHPGLAYHALGGDAWGGHPDCPGQPIIDARPHLLARAGEILAGQPAPEPGASSAVRHLQQLLNSAGGGLAVDGIKGPRTRTALALYLSQDVGTLVQGDSGAAVMVLQAALDTWGYSLIVDGQYGPATLAAVEGFQRSHGCAPDGEVGPITKKALAS